MITLLLQADPTLTPNQVTYRLMSTAQNVGTKTGVGAGELTIAAAVINIAAAVKSASTTSANANRAPAAAIQPGNPAASWGAASWGAASWGP